MTAVREDLPQGRYGRSADQSADRRLRIVGGALGAALLVLLGWYGYHYVVDRSVSGELIKFKRISATAVEAHLEVRKDRDATGSCTLRSIAENGAEVGRKDVRFGAGETRIDTVVTIRTTESATATELVGCTSD
ncbi:DUF4307 domain-containing protein [Streptomyces paludis]|uniref:DUF4307 domain-containing protein n=1 Tax=Streptomyces paludis TaxID=2282738 RepID=A0A345HTF2_9ACTN|nr:DUF4307 domain-containing protein [Streptomyces paludis]AXG79976.1 DUF4307 domain-containing protein [Streptomyces paludis]